ncbi:MAG TPA: hypothetical protein VMM35_05210 [Longimicrobiales bacterium]|nr:hypothetical protein [Longimicrobiales bacterium]
MVLDDSMMRRSDALREMMRLARAIIADGVVTDEEARRLNAWIEGNPDVKGIPAVDDIIGLLTDVLADGRITEPERTELALVLKEFGG